jgi:hypothetical protein
MIDNYDFFTHNLAHFFYWAGLNNNASDNTFMGYYAGQYNTSGSGNSFIGELAGGYNTTGERNSFLGGYAGYSNSTGSGNVIRGIAAGFNETGSNKLYIDNCYTGGVCTQPFIYGEFDNRILKLDGALGLGIAPAYGADVSGTGLSARFRLQTGHPNADNLQRQCGVRDNPDLSPAHGEWSPGDSR